MVDMNVILISPSRTSTMTGFLEYLLHPSLTSGREGSSISVSFDTSMSQISIFFFFLLIPPPGGEGTYLIGETETRESEHIKYSPSWTVFLRGGLCPKCVCVLFAPAFSLSEQLRTGLASGRGCLHLVVLRQGGARKFTVIPETGCVNWIQEGRSKVLLLASCLCWSLIQL